VATPSSLAGPRRGAFWLPVSFAISFFVTEIAHQFTE
jgi:hypothetical protein